MGAGSGRRRRMLVRVAFVVGGRFEEEEEEEEEVVVVVEEGGRRSSALVCVGVAVRLLLALSRLLSSTLQFLSGPVVFSVSSRGSNL